MAGIIDNRPIVTDENGVTYIVRGYEPCGQLSLTHMKMAIARKATHLDTTEERRVFANTRMMEFQNGLNEEYPEQVNDIQQG